MGDPLTGEGANAGRRAIDTSRRPPKEGSMRSIVMLGLGLFIFGGVASAATPVPVTTCGQVVVGTGQLVGDLDCSASADEAVKLSGRLLLNGFTLTGNPAFDVVRCEVGRCGVSGPGTITGGADGVRSDRGARIDAGALVTGNAGDGVRTESSAKVLDATVDGNGGDGVRSKSRATIQRSTVSGNGGDGVRTDSTASLKESTVTGNAGAGVDSDRSAKARLSTVTANGLDGLKGLRVVLSSSTATGNGTAPICGVVDDCADLAAARLPRLRGASACDTSRDTENGGSWGVCAND
jgi:hypothetical protein